MQIPFGNDKKTWRQSMVEQVGAVGNSLAALLP